MFRTILCAGAAAVFGASVAFAGNSDPHADNYQPFMWEKPQVLGEPMTVSGLSMEDRASPASTQARTSLVGSFNPSAPQSLDEGRGALVGEYHGCRTVHMRIQRAWRDAVICE
jgi:hypothetical protein